MVLTAVGWLSEDEQRLVRLLNVGGSLAGLVALVLLMSREWSRMIGPGQRWRYWALLSYVMLLVYGNGEALRDDVPVRYATLAGLVVTTFMLVAVVVTWRDSLRRDRRSS